MEKIEIFNKDFQESDIQENSIDLILTDPPYPKEFLPLWSSLGKFAERVLKPSKFLIAYSGQMYLPEVLNRLNEHLNYFWTGMIYHRGANQLVMGRKKVLSLGKRYY